MKRLLLLLTCLLGITACSQSEKESSTSELYEMSGYIVFKEFDRILVVENISEEDALTKSVRELRENDALKALKFIVTDEDLFNELQIGEFVTVEHDKFQFLSDPGLTCAKNITRHGKTQKTKYEQFIIATFTYLVGVVSHFYLPIYLFVYILYINYIHRGMFMWIHLSNESKEPLYVQLKTQLKQQIIDGTLEPNEELPSIRMLAKSIKTSVITVKRAYADLEQEGFLYTRAGVGTFVKRHEAKEWSEKARKTFQEETKKLLHLGRSLGLHKQEMANMIQEVLEGEET